MPATSKQQFKKMFVLHKQGKISKEELDKFTKVDFDSLPRKRKQNAAAKLLAKKQST